MFHYRPCDASRPDSGPLLTSPIATIDNHASAQLNVSFCFDRDVSSTNSKLLVFKTSRLGHVDQLLTTVQPSTGQPCNQVVDICLPPGIYSLVFVGSTDTDSLIAINGVQLFTNDSNNCSYTEQCRTDGTLLFCINLLGEITEMCISFFDFRPLTIIYLLTQLDRTHQTSIGH